MDGRLIFLHCAWRLIRGGRTYTPDPTISRVGWGPGNGAARGQLVAEVWNAGAEKSPAGTKRASVLKLTQVGEESILRRSREPLLRN
jgi:hypothetical protein